jgi:hypothetical protein
METYTESAGATQRRPPEADGDVREAIERRARELWEQRGRVDGHAEEDWRQAEAEILKARAEAATRVATRPAFILIKAGDFTYTGEYDLGHCDCYRPGDLRRGTSLTVRFEGEKMYVKLPNGRELETRVVRRTSS